MTDQEFLDLKARVAEVEARIEATKEAIRNPPPPSPDGLLTELFGRPSAGAELESRMESLVRDAGDVAKAKALLRKVESDTANKFGWPN